MNFTYDGAGRLKAGSGLYGYADIENNITYDKNGNLKTLNRAGSAVDHLTYSYTGNRLSSLTDASGNHSGVKGGTSSYGYDANGNMTTDGNRGATLTYNYLNLPQTVTAGSKTYSYDYDAAGSKYQYAGDTVNIKYAGPFEYDAGNGLKRIAITDGQIVPSGDTLAFQYYLKDHLGNVKLVFDENGDILQETDYYSFGLAIARDNPAQNDNKRNTTNRYLYNEKELQVGSGYLDYGARMYMPEIGRWGVVDPLSEVSRRWSPYSYGYNNPVRFIDPDGRLPDDYYDRETGKYLGSDGAPTTNSRLIAASQYSQISQSNGGATSTQATTELQSNSQIITIEDGQIQTTLQGVRDNSRGSGVEHSAYITLNPETATISAVAGPTGDNGKTSIEYERSGETTYMTSGESNQVTGLSIMLGQVHGHPLTQEAGMVNVRGTSDLDKDAARNSGIPIYSIDSYSGKKIGGVGSINRVTPNGVQTNGVGQTIGTGKISNFNIGLDALQRSGGKIK